MKRASLWLALAPSALCSTITFASLYSWNNAKRPPVTLSDALARAEKLLGDDARNRYCVSVSLYGDAKGGGKDGAWNLLYAAADGSKKHVYIDMRGESRVKLWNGPIDWKKNEGRRTGLGDVHRRLQELFARERMAAEFEPQDGGLVVKYRTRTFQIYPERDDGGYAEQLQHVPGPSADGIWLRLQVVDRPDPREQFVCEAGPYWEWLRGTYLLTEPGKFLAVDLRHGKKLSEEMTSQMQQIFGEQTPRGG